MCYTFIPTSIISELDFNNVSKLKVFKSTVITIHRYPDEPRSMENVFIFIELQDNRTSSDMRVAVNIEVKLHVELNISTTYVQEPGDRRITVHAYMPSNSPASNAYVRIRDLVLDEIVAAGFTNENGEVSFSINTTKLGCCRLRPHRVEVFYDVNKNGLYDYFNSIILLIGSMDVDVDLYLRDIKELLNITQDSWFLNYEFPPTPLSDEFYITCIPGLPSLKIVSEAIPPLPKEPLVLSLSSYVEYKLITNEYEYRDSYVVKGQRFKDEKKPLIILLSDNVNNLDNTLGLSPDSWSIPMNNDLNLKVIALDNSEIMNVVLEYSVNNGPWLYAELHRDEFMDYIEDFCTEINEKLIKSFEKYLIKLTSITIPRAKPPLTIYTASVSVRKGSFVKYRARAEDRYGNKAMSLIGYCYVHDPSSSIRVLVVDPHVKLRLIQENAEQLRDFTTLARAYGLTNKFLDLYNKYLNISQLISKNKLIQFHHWEYLGEMYRLRITWPSKNLVKEIQSYRPNVIILSNLYLGLETPNLWNWDLSTEEYSGVNVLDFLLNYIEENHVGLIVTHGTLSEFTLWLNSTEFKVFSGGYVVPDSKDINLVIHKSLADALGLSLLTLYKYIKNEIIHGLHDEGKVTSINNYLAPLQILWVPWNGVLIPTDNAKDMNWIIPNDPITIPNPHMYRGVEFRAYTQIGWQLGLNTSIMRRALINTSKYKDTIANNYKLFLQLIVNSTRIKKCIENLDTIIDLSINVAIPLFQNALSHIKIYDNLISLKITQTNIKIPITEHLLKSIIDSQALRIIAISPDYKAGIIAYDKYWDFKHGYRAIYFSFEIEAGIGKAAKILLQQAVKWCSNWRSVTGLIEQVGGYIRIPKSDANKLRKIIMDLGGTIFNATTILPELGTTNLSIEIPDTTLLEMIIITPNPCNVEIYLPKDLKLLKAKELSNRVRVLTIKPLKKGVFSIELRTRGIGRSLIPLLLEIRSSLRTPEIPKYMSVISRTITKTPYLGEEIEITLTRTAMNTTYEQYIKDIIVYEIIPQEFEVVKANGEVIRTSFGIALETMIPLELRNIIIEYLQNLSNEFYEYIPSSADNITLIKFSLANLSKVAYEIKAIDITRRILIAGSILIVKTPKECYAIPGLVTGDHVLRVNPPKFTEIKFKESNELQIIIDVEEIEKFDNLTINVYIPQKYVNALRQLTIVLPEILHKEVITQLNLELLQHRCAKNLIIAILDNTTKSILKLYIPNLLELPRIVSIESRPNFNGLIRNYVNVFPLITFKPIIKTKELMTINFEYSEDVLRALSIDEECIRLILYNSSSKKLIELITSINPGNNTLSAQTKYIDSLIIVGKQSETRTTLKSLTPYTSTKYVLPTELEIVIIIISISIVAVLIIIAMMFHRSSKTIAKF